MANVNEYNIGTSNYAQLDLQPWDVWEVFFPDGFEASIFKRLLRDNGRNNPIEEYEKIIHTCLKCKDIRSNPHIFHEDWLNEEHRYHLQSATLNLYRALKRYQKETGVDMSSCQFPVDVYDVLIAHCQNKIQQLKTNQ